MIHPASLVILFLLVGSAQAGPTCTTAPSDTWLPQDAMGQRIETEGYRIVLFETTPQNFYEICGRDKPVSGRLEMASVR